MACWGPAAVVWVHPGVPHWVPQPACTYYIHYCTGCRSQPARIHTTGGCGLGGAVDRGQAAISGRGSQRPPLHLAAAQFVHGNGLLPVVMQSAVPRAPAAAAGCRARPWTLLSPWPHPHAAINYRCTALGTSSTAAARALEAAFGAPGVRPCVDLTLPYVSTCTPGRLRRNKAMYARPAGCMGIACRHGRRRATAPPGVPAGARLRPRHRHTRPAPRA